MAAVPCACVKVVAAAPGRPQRRSVACGAAPSGPGGSKQPPPSRGPGAAPLRMQTDDQRKFGYGGDGCAWRSCGVCASFALLLLTTSPLVGHLPPDDGGSGRGGDDGGRWEPGNNDDGVRVWLHAGWAVCLLTPLIPPHQVNPVGLAILGVVGLWAYWEWKRPGGRLNPRTRYA
jgi:hypothetical protein